MRLVERLLIAMHLIEPSDYDGFFDNVSWKNFRLDESVMFTHNYPTLGYVRKLQFCYGELLEEMGNNYLYDTDQLREEFNNMHFENCRLEKELAKANGQIESLKRQLSDALQWQTATGRKNEVLHSNGYAPEETREHPKSNNRFVSMNGNSRKENMVMCSVLHESGWNSQDIAEYMKLSISSVKSYISTMKKHYTVIDRNGQQSIMFDSDYDNKTEELGTYNREDYRKETSAFPLTAEAEKDIAM